MPLTILCCLWQKFKSLNVDDLDIVVEPGIGWIELNEYLKPYGLFFPLDPGHWILFFLFISFNLEHFWWTMFLLFSYLELSHVTRCGISMQVCWIKQEVFSAKNRNNYRAAWKRHVLVVVQTPAILGQLSKIHLDVRRVWKMGRLQSLLQNLGVLLNGKKNPI